MDTIYLPGLEIGLMAAMLNGVAMLSQQKTLIWSVALTAAVLLTLKGVASAPSMRWPALQNGLFGGLVAICLASFLTSPSMKRSVNVQGIASGVVARVDNVPVAVSLPYTLVSSIVFDAQQLVRTVISNVNPSYDQLSVDANGLVNPLKSLLNLRSLAYKTGSLESGISEIISSCLSSDSGYLAADYAKIGKLVMNSGNTGASSAQSIAIPGITTLPTNIGALLYQATLNTSDKVPGYVLASDPSLLLSCSDAVSAVASEISTALTSDDFKKWITGSVNSMDTVNPSGTPTYASLVTTYGNTRKMVVSNYTAASSAQATADVLNMAFYELVDSQLNCLRTSGEAKAACLASVNQSIEMERKNLQDAANMSTSMAYMGQFGPQVLSLLVILSPFFFMFAMFSGMGAWTKLGRVIGYVIVPLVMPGIAAEAVNAMLLYKFAAFINVLTDGGYLSHSLVHEAYKELSMNIGTASSLMASLPAVIMGLVGLSELAARTYEKATSASSASTTNTSTPTMVDTSAVLATRSAGTVEPNLQGSGILRGAGSSESVLGGSFMSLSQAVTSGYSEAKARETSVSNATNWIKDTTRLFSEGNSNQTGFAKDLFTAIKKSLDKTTGTSTSTGNDTNLSTTKTNDTSAELGVGLNAGFKASTPGAANAGKSGGEEKGGLLSLIPSIGFSAGVDVSGKSGASAKNQASALTNNTQRKSAEDAERLTQALSSDDVQKVYRNSSKETRAAFDELFKKSKSATQTLASRDSQTDSFGATAELKMQLANNSANADAATVSNAIHSSPNFRFATLQAEMAANQNPVFQDAIEAERKAMSTGQRPGSFVSDRAALSAVATMRALGRIAGEQEPSAQRDDAQRLLIGMYAAMNDQKTPILKDTNKRLFDEDIPSAAPEVSTLENEVEDKMTPKSTPSKTYQGQRGKTPGPKPVVRSGPAQPLKPTDEMQAVNDQIAAGAAAIAQEQQKLKQNYVRGEDAAKNVGLLPGAEGETPGVISRVGQTVKKEIFGNGPSTTNLNNPPKK